MPHARDLPRSFCTLLMWVLDFETNCNLDFDDRGFKIEWWPTVPRMDWIIELRSTNINWKKQVNWTLGFLLLCRSQHESECSGHEALQWLWTHVDCLQKSFRLAFTVIQTNLDGMILILMIADCVDCRDFGRFWNTMHYCHGDQRPHLLSEFFILPRQACVAFRKHNAINTYEKLRQNLDNWCAEQEQVMFNYFSQVTTNFFCAVIIFCFLSSVIWECSGRIL